MWSKMMNDERWRTAGFGDCVIWPPNWALLFFHALTPSVSREYRSVSNGQLSCFRSYVLAYVLIRTGPADVWIWA